MKKITLTKRTKKSGDVDYEVFVQVDNKGSDSHIFNTIENANDCFESVRGDEVVGKEILREETV